MICQINESNVRAHYEALLRDCSRNPDFIDEVRILRVETHYKSTLVYITSKQLSIPTHVIKVDIDGDWSPKREFDGFKYIYMRSFRNGQ